MFTNPIFWILVLVCLAGYLLFRFGMIYRGVKRSEVEFTGGIILLGSFSLVIFFIDWEALFGLVGIFFIVITPIVEIIIATLYKRLYGATDQRIAKKYNTTVEDVRFNTYKFLNKSENVVVDQVTKELLNKYNKT